MGDLDSHGGTMRGSYLAGVPDARIDTAMTMAVTELHPSPPGLTGAEAAQRLRTEGANLVARPRPLPPIVRIGRQLRDPLILLLLAALVVTVAIGDFTDAAIIGLVVVVNTAIGVVQEIRADRAIAALDDLAAPTARVVRAGDDLVVPAAEVVRGDAVRLEAGDIVPADILLTVAHRLRLDESALTGESVALSREAGD